MRNAAAMDGRIKLVELTEPVARRVMAGQQRASLAEALGDAPLRGTVVGPGDILDVAIWEAPPAALFGTSVIDTRLSSGLPAVAKSADIPQQMVDGEGRITVPFIGSISVTGRTPRDVAREIAARLSGKANDPQVIVRIAENQAAQVTVVGDVVNSRHVSLTTKGERLLDALASAGGVRQPVDKMTIQITRGGKVATQPLSAVIRDPLQNIRLGANDVVTALYQPYSFQALGAFGINAEVNFEATGLTLAQALGRIGGLQDNRADIKGVFIFRLEDPAVLDPELAASAPTTPDGKIPVIYRVDMANPATFFVAQGFPIQNRDVLYVSNAPLVDIQKFVNVVSSMAFSVVSVGNAVN
ncbi:polysaccharide biosynthesis/export family protein [Novosphingobium arvoryzae]|uniref:polysaccharide biosynthesis/export family protein n=1 Tax=Novosphingobium arvoryzae TaxID=1256514 RepID=UPI0035B31960